MGKMARNAEAILKSTFIQTVFVDDSVFQRELHMIRVLILSVAMVLSLSDIRVIHAQSVKVDSCDVTWLWPVPKDAAAVDALIGMDDLKSADGNPVWSDAAFADLLAIIDSNASAVKVSGTSRKIGLLPEFRDRKSWKIAGLRFDPTAPGGDDKMRDQFGETPQIRLIVQPVTVAGGNVKVHDFASHVVFSYIKGLDGTKKLPDRDKFNSILSDVLALKKLCADQGIQTAGAKLGIHPGLADNSVPGLTAKMKELLAKHLDAGHLSAMAMMGLQSPEPWIFVATFRPDPNGPFKALPIPVFTDPGAATPADKFKTAEMLTFQDSPVFSRFLIRTTGIPRLQFCRWLHLSVVAYRPLRCLSHHLAKMRWR
jgi:hypothetical protein